MAKIADFRFDETTWRNARDLQRAEWKLLLEELVHDGDFDEALAGRYMLATSTAAAVLFEALDEEGVVVRAVRLELSALTEPIREYAGIIGRLQVSDDSYNTASFQALDMAKKVVHDRGVEILYRTIGTN